MRHGMVTRREDRARAAANEQSWREFLEGIGGVESLNFGWCRQSGNKWSLLAGKEAKQRRHLRALVHEGVGIGSCLNKRSRTHCGRVCGST